MVIKSNIKKISAIRPNLSTFKIGLDIAFGKGTAIDLLYPGQALSYNLGDNALGQEDVFRTQGGK